MKGRRQWGKRGQGGEKRKLYLIDLIIVIHLLPTSPTFPTCFHSHLVFAAISMIPQYIYEALLGVYKWWGKWGTVDSTQLKVGN
jgi:hypothetical protein